MNHVNGNHSIQDKPAPTNQKEMQRTLSLAALTQAACLVESIAQEGKCDSSHFEQNLDALLDDDYIKDRHFSMGCTKLHQLLTGRDINHAKHILAHTATLMAIEKKLAKQPDLLKHIAHDMKRIHKQAAYFDNAYHENVLASIAHTYGETVSSINPRVIVRGKPEHLSQKQHTEKVRCLLFSGIRAAWVWRTSGGNAMRLIFGRKKIIRQLEKLRHPA